MSEWTAHRPSTGVFMHQGNGHISTELLSHNSPLHPHYNSHSQNAYHYGNGHRQDNVLSNGYAQNTLSTRHNNNIIHGYSLQPHNNLDCLPQEHNLRNVSPTHTWGTRPSLQSNHLTTPGMPARNGNASLFDLLAKTQVQRGYSNRVRRGSGIRRGSKGPAAFVDTIAVLQQSNSTCNVGPKSLDNMAVGQPLGNIHSAYVAKSRTEELLLAPQQLVKEERLSITISEETTDYTSVFKQIREVNRESKTEIEYIVKSFRILRNTAVMTILLVMVLLLPFGMVVLGVKYLDECPKEPFLPIYLLVGGCFTTLKMFTVLWRQMKERKNSESFDGVDGENKSDFITDRSTQFTDVVLSLFLLAWFLYGNYLTWSIFMPDFSRQLHKPSDWCEKSLYMFCVIQIIACYSVFVMFLWTLGCLCCARHICCFKDKHMAVRISRS